ncbi:MAG: hypothetical protein ACI8P9_005089 [Parasphingorhabdus sp.]|jgi:hypothetical protein
MRMSKLVCLAALIWASSSMAFDEAHLQQLKDTKSCVGCDLTYANLTNAKYCNTTMWDGSISNSGC